MPEPHASLASGLLLGIDLEKGTLLYEALLSAGLIHIVVLSGTNVSLIHNSISAILMPFEKKFRVVITLITTVLFCIWVGPEPPIFRAVTAALISGIGSLAGRPVSGVYTLALTAAISLLMHPEWASSLSFALTYAASAALVLSGKLKTGVSHSRSPVVSVFFVLLRELKTSLLATLGTAPLIWYFFGRIQLHSILSTTFISWTIVPVTILGFITICLNEISRSFGLFLAVPLRIILNFIITIGYTFA
ncbi:MAG: ComEC/Rec2 family competence protein [Patescibacteria group bacterium]|nr:ComEC/Rec2 family competence protein [Patescibacteria group bacterium]